MRVSDALGVTRRLGVRIVAFLSVALLPVGLIAVWQTLEVGETARQRSEIALLALTDRATLTERQLIQRSMGAAYALSNTVGSLVATGECDEAMQDFVTESGRYSYAGYVTSDGRMVCSSDGRRFDFGDTEEFASWQRDPRPMVGINRAAPLSERSVLIASQPVTEDGGDGGIGFVFVSLPHSTLSSDEIFGGRSGTEVEMLTINAEGEVLTASSGLEDAARRLPPPEDLAKIVGRPPDVLRARDGLGRQRLFAVVPLVPDTVYALGSWADDSALASPLGRGLPAWLFPIIMWALSLVVAYVAVHRLVIRHIRALKGRMRDFAKDRRLPVAPLPGDAPAEIVEMEADFAAMTDQILHDEAESEDRLHEQKVLMKEVHHRVKNNLQLISSIINMQMRQLRSAEARHLLKRVQDRVLGLATIHRNLYQTSDVAHIRADQVLSEIVTQLVEMGTGAGDGIELSLDLAPITLYPDQAVPLSLLATEATSNAIKYVGRPADGGPPRIDVALHALPGGEAELGIANTKGAPLRPIFRGEDGTGLGRRLIEAFAAQLGARPQLHEDEGTHRLSLTFRPSGFEESEMAMGAAAPAAAQARAPAPAAS